MNNDEVIKIAKSDGRAILDGLALSSPSILLGSLQVVALPWLAGRQAGMGAYLMETGHAPDGYGRPCNDILDKNTLAGYSLRNCLRNAWDEVKGIGATIAPAILSVPFMSAMAGPEIEISNAMGAAFGILVIGGGYLASRFYSKNVLAPKYTEMRMQEIEADKPAVHPQP